jgi:hypothetical protein
MTAPPFLIGKYKGVAVSSLAANDAIMMMEQYSNDIEMPLHGSQVRRIFSLIISHINIDASREILHFLQFAIPNRLE